MRSLASLNICFCISKSEAGMPKTGSTTPGWRVATGCVRQKIYRKYLEKPGSEYSERHFYTKCHL